MWRHIVHPYVGAYTMNKRLPFFVEVCENSRNVSAEPRLCQKVMTHLFRQRILPLPFAANVHELADMAAAIKQKAMSPAIFIVETSRVEDVPAELDRQMAQTPALFLRRDPHAFSETRNLSPRLTSVWTYGSTSVDSIAERAAYAVAHFLEDGEFNTIERMNPSLVTQPSS
jgi:hypothetical protein